MHIPARAFAAPCLLISSALLPCAARGQAAMAEQMTPLLLTVNDISVPFHVSDGRAHLVYELAMTNFSSGDVAIRKLEILGNGAVLETLDAAAVAQRLQPAGLRESTATFSKSTYVLLFLNVSLVEGA